MAKRSRQSVLKRLREQKRAEKSEQKRLKRELRRSGELAPEEPPAEEEPVDRFAEFEAAADVDKTSIYAGTRTPKPASRPPVQPQQG